MMVDCADGEMTKYVADAMLAVAVMKQYGFTRYSIGRS
jgi:hypothetical protein